MSKYLIEGGIDFYSELYKSLDDNNNDADNDDENICLITNAPLMEKFVTLKCKHKFNYVPLFKDIMNRRTFKLETQRLKHNEISCPYCRNIQNELLPYYDDMGVEKVHGINFIDENVIVEKTSSNDKYKFGICNYKSISATGEPMLCINTYVSVLTEDGKEYCSYHKRITYRVYVKNKLIKKKLEEKKAKLEEKQKKKEEEKKAKMEEKQKKKDKNDKENVSIKTNQIINLTGYENVVITSNCGCKQILKTGARKGEMCGLKIKSNDFCTRHSSKLT